MTIIVTKTPLFIVTTPYPAAPTITLYEETWAEHVISRHTEMEGKEQELQAVVESVTTVCHGNSGDPNYVVFVNPAVTSERGTPMIAVVDCAAGEVVTGYYNRSFKVITPDQVLWLLPKK